MAHKPGLRDQPKAKQSSSVTIDKFEPKSDQERLINKSCWISRETWEGLEQWAEESGTKPAALMRQILEHVVNGRGK